MNILSFSDVITNSSSEVFVLHPKPEVNKSEFECEIEVLLESLCRLAGKDPDDMYTIYSSETSYIDEDYHYNVEVGDVVIESNDDNSIPSWLMEFIGEINYMPKFKDKFSGYYAEDLGEKKMPMYKWNNEKRQYEDIIELRKIESIQRRHLG